MRKGDLIRALAAAFLIAACRAAPPAAPRPGERLSPVAAMAGVETEGFARALEPREFVFPADHGPHPDFKLEWWYFVGNLQVSPPTPPGALHVSPPTPPGALDDDGGRRFGFQLTFFRQALTPSMPERRSAWATAQIYMAHFVVTDAGAGRFHSFERTSRGALGLAGAQGSPFRVWIEDWSVESTGEGFFPLRLQAAAGDAELDLTLESGKPPVLQGEKGLSQKSPGPGNASYYYSYTRMPARGTVTAGGRSFKVRGSGWLDREWSTSGLGENQEGWDWFALQLDDGRDVMIYHLRRRGGGVEPLSHGSVVSPQGEVRPLRLEDFQVEVLGRWKSPEGTVYPAGWRLGIPSEDLDLEIEPLLADQELDVSFRYWEGAVRVRGRTAPERTGGRGYVELVGYEDARTSP